MRKYVYPTVEHVQEVTDFKDAKVAKAAIEALMWLDQGAPHKFDGLPGKFTFTMGSYVSPITTDKGCGTACCLAGAIQMYLDGGNEDLKPKFSFNL